MCVDQSDAASIRLRRRGRPRYIVAGLTKERASRSSDLCVSRFTGCEMQDELDRNKSALRTAR